MGKVIKSLEQEISIQKHELKHLSGLYQGLLEDLSIQCTMHFETLKSPKNDHFIKRLKGEILFILEHIVLQDIESIRDLLKRYLLSDGSRLNISNRKDISQIRGTLRFKVDEGRTLEHLNFDGHSDDIKLKVEENNFGRVDVVYENELCGLYRLRLAPYAKIPVHMHKKMLESELVASDDLYLQGQPVQSGTSIQWPQGFPHYYENLSPREQLVVCIDKPVFDTEDEILLDRDTPCPELEENMVKHYW